MRVCRIEKSWLEVGVCRAEKGSLEKGALEMGLGCWRSCVEEVHWGLREGGSWIPLHLSFEQPRWEMPFQLLEAKGSHRADLCTCSGSACLCYGYQHISEPGAGDD